MNEARLEDCPHCGGPGGATLVLPGGYKRYGCSDCCVYARNPEDWNRRKTDTGLLEAALWYIEFLGMPRSGPYDTKEEAAEAARMVMRNTGHRVWVFREVDREEILPPWIYRTELPADQAFNPGEKTDDART